MNKINAASGPGQENDSHFVYKIIELIWGFEELRKRSVTGIPSNAFEHHATFPGLEKEKLEYIYGI